MTTWQGLRTRVLEPIILYAMVVIRSLRLRTVVLVLLVAAAGGATTRLVRAQSLAEVAKKEEERRKSVPAKAKVYTNKDLAALPPGSAPPSSGTSDSPAPKTDADSAKDAKEPAAKVAAGGLEGTQSVQGRQTMAHGYGSGHEVDSFRIGKLFQTVRNNRLSGSPACGRKHAPATPSERSS